MKAQFKEIDINRINNINSLIDSQEFAWLPFEVRCSFKKKFGDVWYTNDDIVYAIKVEVFDFLFSDIRSREKNRAAEIEANRLLRNNEQNQGWMDMDDLVKKLEKRRVLNLQIL